MAFNIACFTTQTSGLNAGGITTSDNPSTTPVIANGPAWFTYASATDALATIAAANYFLPVLYDLQINDRIDVTGSDSSAMYIVSNVVTTPGSQTVTLESYSASATVGTANISPNAITTALLANNAVTSATVALNMLQYVKVALTAAQFKGMYATPVQLVSAGGANTLIVLDQLQLLMTFVSADYAAGGVAAVQYDSTADGAGVIASATQTAAAFQAAASTGFRFGGAAGVAETFSTCVNKGLYLSNITGAFTTGDSTFEAHVWYKIIPTV